MTVRILQGDCRSMLALLPDASVHCVVTSPPYYGLRDYGTGQWEGGDPDCSHGGNVIGGPKQTPGVGANGHSSAADKLSRRICALCGATKTDQQIGLEETPAEYVAALVAVFREVKRVLRPDGICFINLGDSYCSGAQETQYVLREDCTLRELQDVALAVFGLRFAGDEAKGEGSLPPVLSSSVYRQSNDGGPSISGEGEQTELSASSFGGDFEDGRTQSQNEGGSDNRAGREVCLLRRDDATIPHVGSHQRGRRGASEKGGTLNNSDIQTGPAGGVPEEQVPNTLLQLQLRDRIMGFLSARQFTAAQIPSSVRACFKAAGGLKPKDLIMIPARVALALQDDGWWLRSDVIWHKPNPMPESTEDRPTSSHEHVFLLAKSGSAKFWTHRERAGTRVQPAPDYRWVHRETGEEIAVDPGDDKRWRRVNLWRGSDYFFDAEAVREQGESGPSDLRKMAEALPRIGGKHKTLDDALSKASAATNIGQKRSVGTPGTRNIRNVWTITTTPFPEAHFATFPPELAERCIKAGTSERGCCPSCAAPWVRIITKGEPDTEHQRACGADVSGGYNGQSIKNHAAAGVQDASAVKARILAGLRERSYAWQPSCSCDAGDPVPCTVLDPFAGAFTAPLVADRLQRHAIGIELNRAYCEMARRRIERDAGLFADLAAD